jgi:Eco57I restriction-modification methylase
MPPLSDSQRGQLEKAVTAARQHAEAGARAALQRLFVDNADSKVLPAGFSEEQRALRVHLRAHARQIGDQVPGEGEQSIDRLVAACAYEFWHRMLFARYLAENGLLIHDELKVPMTLAECRELADENGEDPWELAARCAARMLPMIFRPGDPLLKVTFAPERRRALEEVLDGLSTQVFTADDSLGWVYQFWQAEEKKRVNKSEKKIGGNELPAVTQLFTEPYMVQFLLHNTLGAWWWARQTEKGNNNPELPGYTFEYLRFCDDGNPAAGTFAGWPKEARELKVLDPCCGSGHFLIAAFDLLVRIRMHGEGVAAPEACDAVLRDNLFGLELDARCTQIAAFNLALAAWRFPGAGGYREKLPQMHLACSGQAPKGTREEWLRLIAGDRRLRWGMECLYDLFQQANYLGSLIDPRRIKIGPGIGGSFEELQPALQEALQREEVRNDADFRALGVAAEGIARAADLLTRQYHLILTNVPYLVRGKQSPPLKAYLKENYRPSRMDLATAFLERCLTLCRPEGCVALVTPQNWLFLQSYQQLRVKLLEEATCNLIVRLGPGAFQTIGGEVVKVALSVLMNSEPSSAHTTACLDATVAPFVDGKRAYLLRSPVHHFNQATQLQNPDARIVFGSAPTGPSLSELAVSSQGLKTGDDCRVRRFFWEIAFLGERWRFLQSTVEGTMPFGGSESIIDWHEQGSDMARLQGGSVWGKRGVAVKLLGSLPCSLYMGHIFDSNISPIVPHDSRHVGAIWAFCQSPEYTAAIRRIDQKMNVTEGTLVKVPFDLPRWQAEADRLYPNGLPEPHSNDPTQWLFKGGIVAADAPHNLQVALARLLGYRWPDQSAEKLDPLALADGILCLPRIGDDPEGAERLRTLLAAAYGPDWSAAREKALLAAVDFDGKSLHEWLRDGFFEQHCKLFHNRPFLWHVWDGRKDGFSAILNYHKFDRTALETVIHHHLGLWIKRQEDEVKAGAGGADGRLASALRLKKQLLLILEGEEPHDIFVRWKPLEEQPIGWEPDLNDGVRLNIRPFATAFLDDEKRLPVLRKKVPALHWKKDKGRDPESAPWYPRFKGDRINDHHLSLKEKKDAREAEGETT